MPCSNYLQLTLICELFFIRSESQAAPNTSENSGGDIVDTAPRDSLNTSADESSLFTDDSSAVVPPAVISTQTSSVCSTSSDYPAATPWTCRERDKFGRFKDSTGDQQKRKDDGQKQRDKICANVSKWKRNIVENIQKIQAVRPDASQTYLFESDLKKTRINPVVCKTTGNSRAGHSTSIGPIVSFEMVANDKDADELDPVNTEGSDDEDVPEIPVDGSSQVVVRTVKNRICDKMCYVCKTKVGPDSSKRIGNFANNLFKTFYKCHRNNH